MCSRTCSFYVKTKTVHLQATLPVQRKRRTLCCIDEISGGRRPENGVRTIQRFGFGEQSKSLPAIIKNYRGKKERSFIGGKKFIVIFNFPLWVVLIFFLLLFELFSHLAFTVTMHLHLCLVLTINGIAHRINIVITDDQHPVERLDKQRCQEQQYTAMPVCNEGCQSSAKVLLSFNFYSD